MRAVLDQAKPDVVFVHGDTTTSMASALAAYYRQIPVAHVEAGLRTGNIYSPWPEEMNRQLTGRIASLHFAPTPLSCSNLIREGVPADRIVVTGNTVIDALHLVVSRIKGDTALQAGIRQNLLRAGYDLGRLDGNRKSVLITGTPEGEFRRRIHSDVYGDQGFSLAYAGVDFIYPMHLNPQCERSRTERCSGRKADCRICFLRNRCNTSISFV